MVNRFVFPIQVYSCCVKKARKKGEKNIFVQLYHRQKDCVFMYVFALYLDKH